MSDIINTFVTFFVVIDPVGTLPIFLAVTKNMNSEIKIKVATKAVIIAAIILVCFVALGQIFLEHAGVRISAFQIAGGIVFFIFALKMIFESDEVHEGESEPNLNVAVFPLALPSIASPGAMLAAVILTDNDVYSIQSQILTTIMILLVMFLVWVLLRFAEPINKKIGHTGTMVISKVMGLILVSISVELILQGIETTFHLK